MEQNTRLIRKYFFFFMLGFIEGCLCDEISPTNITPSITESYRDARFRLFNRGLDNDGVIISVYNSSEYLKTVFLPERDVKLAVHGWLGSEKSSIVKDITRAYIEEHDVNSIRMDWSYLSGSMVYPLSAYNVEAAGSDLARLMDHLVRSGVTSPNHIHLIGHSLGAHLVGTAGEKMQTGKPGRITGLDPARPGFEVLGEFTPRTLDKSDGEFVDVIHSAGGVAGYLHPLGHADYYPNGGVPPQPGCLKLMDPTSIIGCSHTRAYEFYIESIKPSSRGFKSLQCSDWNSYSRGNCQRYEPSLMGDPATNSDNTVNHTLLIPEDESSLKKLNLKKPLKMIIHGWRNGYDSPLGEIVKDAYLGKRRRKLIAQDVNVIVLDWSSKSFNNYIGARMNVPKVADEVVRLLEGLVKLGLNLDNVHLIGHSLGAHIAGIAGNRMKSGQIARVTGLDPAAPMFTITEEDILKPYSAKFVDVIHTCGYMLGFLSPLGHADFYPNKGTPAQPGCGFDYKGECSHSRAYELYAESIDSKDMLAIQCGDVTHFEERRCFDSPPIPMGEHTPSTARGLFFLNTNRKTPYARGAKF